MSETHIETAFRNLCEAHDLTYAYSDDSSVYRKGKGKHDEIIAMAKQLDPASAARIWNEFVDQKILHDREYWYWSADDVSLLKAN